MLALFHRERTGVAQKVSTSLAAMSVLLQTEALTRHEGKAESTVGSRDHPGPGPLERFYEASDGWFRIDARNVPATTLSAIGIAAPDADSIAEWARARKRDDVLAQLFSAGIPAAPARSAQEYADEAQLREHDVLHVDPRPDREGFTAGRHALFDRTQLSGTLISPGLGEHTREVFAGIGYSRDAIDQLIASGAATGRDPG
jgi:crotonobetainyl-CoA:carnitine CoA-transferase CaiB-like acyl-CoA transferase